MQILEDQHERLRLGERLEKATPRSERLAACAKKYAISCCW